MNKRERMLAACGRRPVDRPPVWLMRQAGRYLPEYLELRQHHEFWEILRSPALSVELAQQPLRRFELDAAIVFSDILVLLEAMGAQVSYENGAPAIGRPFTGPGDLERVRGVQVRKDLAYVGEAVERLCGAVQSEVAVIGFAGAPLTLAAYLAEGGPKHQLRMLKGMFFREPELVRELLDGLAAAIVDLLLLQVEAGADVVQVFDSWACYLGPETYRELALPPLQRVVAALQERRVPVVVYVRGAASHLAAAAATGCDVLSIDASLGLNDARQRLPASMALQGNLDPAELLGPSSRIEERVRAMIEAGGRQGYVVNLGQGLTPDIPVAGVEAMVRAACRA